MSSMKLVVTFVGQIEHCAVLKKNERHLKNEASEDVTVVKYAQVLWNK